MIESTTDTRASSSISGLDYEVHHVRAVSDSAYVVRFARNGMQFQSGQYVSVGLKGDINMREYSVYSSPKDDYLEILVKEVEGGAVSKKLRRLSAGNPLHVEGPFGFFVIEPEWIDTRRLYFIATGTGVSPFHSFVRTYDTLDYTVLHGMRTINERYEHEVFDPERYITCVSRENSGNYRGRVTDYLRENPPPADALFYLCGNCDMIYESFDILTGQGVEPGNLFAEVYF